MTENPGAERGGESLTLAEICKRYDVSRTLLHTYRTRGDFPEPISTPGSTRLRYDAADVAAFFERTPKRQGKRPKRPADGS